MGVFCVDKTCFLTPGHKLWCIYIRTYVAGQLNIVDYMYYSNRVVIHCNKNHFELLDAVKMFIMCEILQEILNGTRIMNIYIITLATTYVATVLVSTYQHFLSIISYTTVKSGC